MIYEFAGFNVDDEARQLRRGRDVVHLSPKAFDLLMALIAGRPRALPKRELYDALWPDTFVVEANLPILIGEVRAALDDRDKKMVRTVHGRGYAFDAEVRESVVRHADRGADAFVHMLLVDNRQVLLREGESVVGRDPSADVFLPSASVSRRHALIVVNVDRATVTDLDSKNGTFIGDDPVHASAIADGDLVRFGEVITRYRCGPAGETDTL
jgi:DNA-binding winged helix-turn-helix (wHTH) protein